MFTYYRQAENKYTTYKPGKSGYNRQKQSHLVSFLYIFSLALYYPLQLNLRLNHPLSYSFQEGDHWAIREVHRQQRSSSGEEGCCKHVGVRVWTWCWTGRDYVWYLRQGQERSNEHLGIPTVLYLYGHTVSIVILCYVGNRSHVIELLQNGWFCCECVFSLLPLHFASNIVVPAWVSIIKYTLSYHCFLVFLFSFLLSVNASFYLVVITLYIKLINSSPVLLLLFYPVLFLRPSYLNPSCFNCLRRNRLGCIYYCLFTLC